MSKLARAKELAEGWAWEAKEAADTAAVCSHFDRASPTQLIEMWETGKNIEGEPLKQFESQALAEAWCRVFGEMPPDDDADEPTFSEPRAPEPELPADDTMLREKEVLRLTGVSQSSLKRMVLDGRFPKPMRLSPHRIGWPGRDVKAWLDGLDAARRKARV